MGDKVPFSLVFEVEYWLEANQAKVADHGKCDSAAQTVRNVRLYYYYVFSI
jgi:hypothetical protein